nr:SprB repeat-containing protein [Bacteroidales bacterium]
LLNIPQVTLSEPPAIDVSAVPSLFSGGVNLRCNGGTGSINVSASGGTGGTYTYTWSSSDGSGIVPGQQNQAALAAGTYTISVSDSNSCNVDRIVTLTQPEPLALTFEITDITCEAPGFDNGELTVTAAGGTGPWSILWEDLRTSAHITGLTEGYYSVTVTDANGCSVTDSAFVSPPAPLVYNAVPSDYNGYNISCNGLSNGTITVTPMSGTAPYSYSWTSPTGFTSSSAEVAGLRAGEYYLSIRDSKYCSVVDTITLDEPDVMAVTFVPSESTGGFNISCYGDSTGTLAAGVINNAGEVNYLWSEGSTTQQLTDLPAGQYDVIATDANNCSATGSFTMTEPDQIKIAFSPVQPSCPDKPDGAIELAVTGGVISTDYIYKWSNGSSEQNLAGITEGGYRVTVTDFNSCTATDSECISLSRYGSQGVQQVGFNCVAVGEGIPRAMERKPERQGAAC